MNTRCILDFTAIILCFYSGVGIFMLSGLLGGAAVVSIWFMIIYAIFTSILLCNCCACSTTIMKWLGVFDLIIFRFVSILCTGLAIAELNDFKKEHLDQNDDFVNAVKELIESAVTAITLSLVTQIFGLIATFWWTYIVFSPKHETVKTEEPKGEMPDV